MLPNNTKLEFEGMMSSKITPNSYVSCVAGCPYEGEVPLSQVVQVSRKMYDLGCEEISLSDTIGVANAGKIFEMISAVKTEVPIEKIAVHLHDTYGQAMSNILVALQVTYLQYLMMVLVGSVDY